MPRIRWFRITFKNIFLLLATLTVTILLCTRRPPNDSDTRVRYDNPTIISKEKNRQETVLRGTIPLCSWATEEPLYLASEKDLAEQKLIEWMNDWGVTYVLWDGSLLGAYRHHGKIPSDGDVDIIFPVFLNFPTDDCAEAKIRRPKAFIVDRGTGKEANFSNPDEGFESRLLLCGKTRIQWVQEISQIFKARINETGLSMRVSVKAFGGLRLTLTGHGPELGVDVVVSIWDKKFWKDPTPTCRCYYRGQRSQCFESTLDALMSEYRQTEAEILTPLKPRLSRRNPNHAKWKNKLEGNV